MWNKESGPRFRLSPENTHASNTIQVVFKNICACTYRHVTVNGKRDHEFEREQAGCIGGVGGMKGKEEIL